MTTRAASAATTRPSSADMERYLALAAYLVIRHGEQYTPVFERMEREVADLKNGQTSVDRARAVLFDLTRREVTHATAE